MVPLVAMFYLLPVWICHLATLEQGQG